MYNTKELRASLRGLIQEGMNNAGITGFEVAYGLDKKGSARFVVFDLSDLPSMDERSQSDLELNAVGPASDSDTVEALTDAIIAQLDCAVVHTEHFSYYLYKSTRNRVDDSDPHNARIRFTFDLYIYERN